LPSLCLEKICFLLSRRFARIFKLRCVVSSSGYAKLVNADVELVLVVISETHSENCFLAVFMFFCMGVGDRFIIKLDHIHKKAWRLVLFELFKFVICENRLK
jgi:hypothetical protein